jgi:hypothetical protein
LLLFGGEPAFDLVAYFFGHPLDFPGFDREPRVAA